MTAAALLAELDGRGVELWADGGELRFRAPAGALTAELKERLRARRVELLEALAGERPLSASQERIWFLERLRGGPPAFTVPALLALRGPLSIPALAAALAAVVGRHEALRTRGEERDGRPIGRLEPPAPPRLPVVDLRALGAARRPAESARAAAARVRRRFDLGAAPLLRAVLVRLGAGEHRLVIATHHFAVDGWSMRVLLAELAELYAAATAGRTARLRAPAPFADHARRERRRLAEGAWTESLDWWRRRLAGAEPLDLPADRPPPPEPSGRGATLRWSLAGPLTADLEALGREAGATLFATLLAGLQGLLSRLTGQADPLIATAVSNRHRPELEEVVGPLANTVVLRTGLDGDPGLRERAATAAAAVRAALARAEPPYDRLVEALRAAAPGAEQAARPGLFFVLQSAPLSTYRLPGLEVRIEHVDTGAAKHDLSLSLERTPEGLVGSAEYAADRFDRTTVRRLLGRLETLLAAAVAEPERPLCRLPLLGRAERHQLLVELNDTATGYPREATLGALFLARAAERPDAVALEWGARRWSYGELDRRSARLASALASALRRAGAGGEPVVGLGLERGPELVLAMLVAVRAGAAYLPFDPAHPAERLAGMLADAGCRLAIAAGGRPPPLADLAVRWTSLAELASAGATGPPPPPPADPAALAMVLYTSGSTGRPKGVALHHRGLVRLVAGADFLRLGAGDRVAQVASASFDAAGFEIWGALGAGATVVGIDRDTSLAPAAFAAELARTRVGAMFLTTALFQLLAREAPAGLAGLDHLLFGGEACDAALVRRSLGDLGGRLLHMYGPTETTVFASWQAVREVPAEAATVPIGGPIAASTLHLLDRRGELLPAGAAGELFLGGDGVARGYAGRPAATAERFVPDPFGPPGSRLYRTGDRARRLAGGAVEFLGRFDDQVKVRGVRIEPGEAAAALSAHPAVGQAAVVARPDRRGELRLIAYAAPASGATPPAPSELLRHLAAHLPPALVPAAAVVLDRLPLTATGKIDRRALPEPAETAATAEPAAVSAPGAAAADPVTELVAAAWAEVLRVETVAPGDDFFALGGHSLLAGRIAARVRERLGVELPLRDLFEAPALGDYAARVRAALAGPRRPPLPPLTPRERPGAGGRDAGLPLSFAQERLWFLDRLEGTRPTYNVPIALRLAGALDRAALAAALTAAVDRHEALRTRFTLAAGGPVQVVEPGAAVPLPAVDLAALGAGAERAARRLARAEARRPFDLGRAPLLRATLLRLGAGDHALLVTVHHVVADGASVEVLMAELAALYRAAAAGLRSPLPPLEIQYPDFAVWQRRVLDDAALGPSVDWWRRRLDGLGPLPLPADRPRPARPSFAGVRARRRLPAPLFERLRGFARAAAATPFMVLLAAYQALLVRASGERDLAVGTPVAGRGRPELEPLVGFFVNTLVVRSEADPGAGLTALVARVREACLGAFAHQEVPFERLVEALRPEREIGRTPLFEAFFTYQAAPALRLDLGGVEAVPLGVDPGLARFDLTLSAAALGGDGDGGGGALVALDAAADRFDRTTAARLLEGFVHLLAAGLAEPDRPLAELPLLGPAARHQALLEWGAEPAALGAAPEADVERWFAAAARRWPEAEAVVQGAVRWSYRDLDRAAGRLAARLTGLGVGAEVVVGVALERSPAAIAALLGVLRAGGVYLPIDPAQPAERRAALLAGAGARVLIAGAGDAVAGAHATLELPPGWPAHGDSARDAAGETPAGGRPPHRLALDRLAYVFYTSGSTGAPKGVAVPHRALGRTLAWRLAEFSPGPGDRVLQSVPPTFDPSLWQVLGALCSGAALVLPERDGDPGHLGELIARERITIADFPPSLLAALLDAGALGAPSLRLVFAGGEALAPELTAAFAAASPARLVDIYGPTEAAIDSACWTCGAFERGTVPIGRPVAGKRLRVAGAGGEPVPAGVAGELWIGGEGLARGYLGRPGATAERFRPDPGAAEPGARVYLSGDRVRHRADGALEFRGRTDRQLKLRGVRIEPGEVEAALAAHPAVAEAAVGIWEPAAGDRRLAAWVTPSGAGTPADPGALRAFLAGRLPAHAVPAAYVRLEALPRNASGKVDRAALPAPAAADAARSAAFAPPQSELERTVAAVFGELLAVPTVGLDDSFFDLGGHSLLLVAARERLVERLGRDDLELIDLFRHPTVRGLARRLAAETPAPATGVGTAARSLREGRARLAERLARRRAGAPGGTA